MPTGIGSGSHIVPGHILVQLKKGVDADRFLQETGLQRIDRIPQIETEILSVPDGQEKAMARQLSARPDVEYAEPDGKAYAYSIPNDPLFSVNQWYLQTIRAPGAWDLNTGSANITIAIIDTGIDASHPDLQGKIVSGYDAVNGDTNPTDDEGHGTHVSGLAAAASNNKIGIAGMSWGAKIMPIKVLNAAGEGSNSAISTGMIWAADHGAKIFNLSLGSSYPSTTMTNAVNYIRNKNGLVVAAAGNDYAKGNPASYPAATSGVIAVGSSNSQDARSSYSETGNYLSVLAPGGDPVSNRDANSLHWIMSTWRTSDGSYQELAGTSQSAPFVSGLAALIWSVRPEFTADQVRKTIEGTAHDLEAAGWDPDTGYGRIDAEAAMNSIMPTAPDTTPPVVSITFPANGDYVSGIVSIKGSVQDANLKSYQMEYGTGTQPSSWFRIGSAKAQSVALGGEVATWSTTSLPDGVYSLRLSAVDRVGNLTYTAPTLVTVDNTPPVLGLAQPTEGQTVGKQVAIQGDVTDLAIDHLTVDLGVGSDPETWNTLLQVNVPLPNPLATVDFSSLNPGPYTLRVTAVDKGGKISQAVVHVVYQATVPGDVNQDGLLNVTDGILVMRMAVGVDPVTDLSLADVAPSPGTGGRPYGDGAVTVMDAIRVLRRSLGLEPDPWPG